MTSLLRQASSIHPHSTTQSQLGIVGVAGGTPHGVARRAVTLSAGEQVGEDRGIVSAVLFRFGGQLLCGL